MNSSGFVVLIVLLITAGGRGQSSGVGSVVGDGSCTVDGVTYADGASWPSVEGCQQCRCSSGLTFCVRTSFCKDLGQCGVIVTLPGACCPVCFGCVSPSGRKTSLNETWQEDDCTQCVCTDGQTKCLASFCQTPCLHPRKVKGECCPVCDDDCHLQCHYGRKVDANGAELCECLKDSEERLNQGDVDTESTSASSEEKEDVKFVTNVEQDVNDVTSRCPEVKCSRLCPHGFQVGRNGCPLCKCQRCKSMSKCTKKCALGPVHDSRGCRTCQCRSPLTAAPTVKCLTTNGSYSSGQRWQLDVCTSCICHHGGPTCTETACPLPCHNPLFIQGQCCPVCSNSGRTVSIDPGSNQSDGVTDGTTLMTVVIICVALVGGLILIVAILALCVSMQCQRLQLHEENMAAAVKLTAVNRLRPKSTNLDYQYNLYLHRYRETPSSCWSPLTTLSREVGGSSEGSKEEGSSSQRSNSPLLMKVN